MTQGADPAQDAAQGPVVAAPAITAVLPSIRVAHATVHVFIGRWYWVPRHHYLTPFRSPCVSGERVPGSASLSRWFGSLPPVVPYAAVALPFALGFRLSCYYCSHPGGARPLPASLRGHGSSSSGARLDRKG